MTEERRHDCEQRDRISRLEMTAEQIHSDLERIHTDFEKMTTSYEKHMDQNNTSFQEVSKTLATVTAALEAQRGQIADLKDVSRNLVDTQTKLLNQFSLIDMHNKMLEKIQEETDQLKEQIQSLKSLEAGARASWKTIMTVASIIAFLISTAISIGAFTLGKSESTKVSTITEYIVSPHQEV